MSSSTAALRLCQTERTISFTLTLPRPHLRPLFRAKPSAALHPERAYTLNEAAFFAQKPLI